MNQLERLREKKKELLKLPIETPEAIVRLDKVIKEIKKLEYQEMTCPPLKSRPYDPLNPPFTQEQVDEMSRKHIARMKPANIPPSFERASDEGWLSSIRDTPPPLPESFDRKAFVMAMDRHTNKGVFE